MAPPRKQTRTTAGPRRPFATTHWSMVVAPAGQAAGASRRWPRLRELLVPALCLRAAGRPRGRRRPGLDPGVLRPPVGQELPGGRRPAARTVPLVPAGSDEALPGQPAAAPRGTETRRPSALLSLDFDSGENRYSLIEPADNLTPERLYQRRWALALLDLVFGRLREEFRAAGKLPLFDASEAIPCRQLRRGPPIWRSPRNWP